MATEWILGIVVATLLILDRVVNTGWMSEIPDSVWNIKWLYRLNLISKIYEEKKNNLTKEKEKLCS